MCTFPEGSNVKNGGGIILQPGIYYGQTMLPIIWQCETFGVKLQGVQLADIYIPEIFFSGDAIVIEARAAMHPNVTNNYIRFVQVRRSVQQGM